MKHNFKENKQQRIDNAHKQAAKNKAQAAQLHQQAGDMMSYIPPGQPILIGHHSEKRHRKELERIDAKFRKASQVLDKATYYEEKAKGMEDNTAISSDDPAALQKLQEKLSTLEKAQSFMKAVNKCIRQQDKAAFLLLEGATDNLWEQLNNPASFGGPGFPSFSLTNNNAKIRSVRERLQSLRKLSEMESAEVTINRVRLVQNVRANRVQLFFPAKPDEATRKKVRQAGFIWCPSEGAWQRKLQGHAIAIAKELLQGLLMPNQ